MVIAAVPPKADVQGGVIFCLEMFRFRLGRDMCKYKKGHNRDPFHYIEIAEFLKQTSSISKYRQANEHNEHNQCPLRQRWNRCR